MHHRPLSFSILGTMLILLVCTAHGVVAATTAFAVGPLAWLRKASSSIQGGFQDQAWFWGWALGPDSAVSIVDRSPAITFPSRPAGFGTTDLTDPLLGYVIPLNAFTAPCPPDGQTSIDAGSDSVGERWLNAPTAPNTACPPLCVVGDSVPDRNESWIALVQRGECQFVDKTREAQRLGAKAVVVGGDDPQVSGNPDVLVNMYSPGDSSDVTIVSTFIRFSDYVQLYALIAASNTSHSGLKTLSLLITSEYSAWQWYSPIITFVTILLIPSSLTFLTLLVHRFRAARAAQRERAPVDIVHSLPWRIWTGTGWEKPENGGPTVDVERGEGTAQAATHTACAADDEGEDPVWFLSQVECIICLEQFAKGDQVRVLPCKHIFHMKEVDEWLIERKKLCPVCKADVTKPSPHAAAAHDGRRDDPRAAPAAASPVPPEPPVVIATERTPLLAQTSSSGS